MDGFYHTPWVGVPLSCYVKSGSVIGRRADKGKPQCDVDTPLERDQLEGDKSLIMVEGNTYDAGLVKGFPEHNIRRKRTADAHSSFLGLFYGRDDLFFFFGSHQPPFSGMGIQPGDYEVIVSTCLAPEAVLETEKEVEKRIPFDPVQSLLQGDMMGEEGHFEALRPKTHDGFGVILAEVLGVPRPADAGKCPGLLGDRGRHQGMKATLSGLVDSFLEKTERHEPVRPLWGTFFDGFMGSAHFYE